MRRYNLYQGRWQKEEAFVWLVDAARLGNEAREREALGIKFAQDLVAVGMKHERQACGHARCRGSGPIRPAGGGSRRACGGESRGLGGSVGGASAVICRTLVEVLPDEFGLLSD